MKNKLIVTAAAVLGLAFAAEAQTITVGPRVGATFSEVNYSGDGADMLNDQLKSKTGVQFGAVANVMVNDLFSVQPELLYVQKGVKVNFGGLSTELQSSYLELPVLAKVSFGSEQIKGFVTAGPSVGYWLSGKIKQKYDGESEEDDYDFTDDDNRTEIGANFGVGAAYKVGTGYLNLDLRYGLGLSNLYNDGEEKVKNRVLGVSLAYLFSL
ncbi:porin family protein [Pontibacter rugosus]|uniref:Porin family protein n=1 Tax=Pontibacter rugosus TaxID=1745966 RepID=A0ABW3SWH9_9BACT